MNDRKRIEFLVVAAEVKNVEPGTILEIVPQGEKQVLMRADNEEVILSDMASTNLADIDFDEIPDSLLTEDEILTDTIYLPRLIAVQKELRKRFQRNRSEMVYRK